ncbi:vacuolar protein sorting-associated protein 60.1-like isoform X2 [Tasmannia lanceolata]|uniref:vacuolar protein sorting-associated protein 60.1-like isoform X2 n=1 Tax=Tasmannia lanceolata TaxID=3420 RepID=UPI004062C1BA
MLDLAGWLRQHIPLEDSSKTSGVGLLHGDYRIDNLVFHPLENMQDEMMDLMDVSNEIQESLGRSYSVPDDIDEDDLMGELDALEADMGTETEHDGMPSYLQPDLEAELNLPSAPSGNAAMPPSRYNAQAEDELGLPAVPQASIHG